jgi:hypothetical protein
VLTQFSEADQVAARYAAGALPLIERIDAGLVEEYLERAIAMRSPVPDVRGAYYRSWNDADLARGVAIYDRHLASLLLGAFEDCLRSKDTRARIDAELEALVLVDPRRAIELAQGLPDTSEDPSFPVKTFTILRVARMLGRHDEARLRAIMRLAGLEVENGEEF